MEVTKDIFFEHENSIVNDKWEINLSYESSSAKSKKIELNKSIKIIEIVENGNFYSAIKIDLKDNNGKTKSCILTGIDGAFILYPKTENNNEGQSIMIKNDNLILSLGFTLISINLKTLEVNWKSRPDSAEIFEFYELDNDIILRGELAIHRINIENGESIWEFGGQDIWINMNGNEEVRINKNDISLCDWDDNKYLIDFNGIQLDFKPKISPIKYKKATILNNPKKWFYTKLWNLVQDRK
jgi:hypothetical protein